MPGNGNGNGNGNSRGRSGRTGPGAPPPVNILSPTLTGGGTAVAPTPAIALAATAARTLLIGGTATLSVTLTRSGGFVGAVTIAVTGLPAHVTASALTLGVGETTGTLTLTADGAATVGSATCTLTATGAGVTPATASCALTVTTVLSGGGGSGLAPRFATLPTEHVPNIVAPTVTLTVTGTGTGSDFMALCNAVEAYQRAGTSVEIVLPPDGGVGTHLQDQFYLAYASALPDNNAWVTIRTSGSALLPPQGRMHSNADWPHMATLRNASDQIDRPAAFGIGNYVRRVRFVGIKFELASSHVVHPDTSAYDALSLLLIGTPSGTNLGVDKIPEDIVLDHCDFVNPDPDNLATKRAIECNGSKVVGRDVRFLDMPGKLATGLHYTDASCIGGWDSKGSWVFDNVQFLRCWGIPVMFGAGAAFNDQRAADFIFRRFLISRDASAIHAFQQHGAKSLFEIKDGSRWLIEDFILEFNGAVYTQREGFSGEVFSYKSANQQADAYGSTYRANDVTVRRFVIRGAHPIAWVPVNAIVPGSRVDWTQRFDLYDGLVITEMLPAERAVASGSVADPEGNLASSFNAAMRSMTLGFGSSGFTTFGWLGQACVRNVTFARQADTFVYRNLSWSNSDARQHYGQADVLLDDATTALEGLTFENVSLNGSQQGIADYDTGAQVGVGALRNKNVLVRNSAYVRGTAGAHEAQADVDAIPGWTGVTAVGAGAEQTLSHAALPFLAPDPDHPGSAIVLLTADVTKGVDLDALAAALVHVRDGQWA